MRGRCQLVRMLLRPRQMFIALLLFSFLTCLKLMIGPTGTVPLDALNAKRRFAFEALNNSTKLTNRPPRPLEKHRWANIKCDAEKLMGVPPYINTSCPTCLNFSCNNVFERKGDTKFYKSLVDWMRKHPYHMTQNKEFKTLAQNCNTFQHTMGYHMLPVDEEEADFPIAFIIVMHKDVAQVERLLRAIYRPQNEYCIHVDAKSSTDVLDGIQAIASCFPNVLVASKLERVVYAGFSRLQADINCMRDLTVKVKTKWRYLINLAGQVFPLMTNAEMVQVLKIYNGANDVEGLYNRVLRSRFKQEWLETNVDTDHPKLVKSGKQNPPAPYDIDIVRGSAYGVFSREYVDFVLTDKKAIALLEWSKKTWSPDEHYWSTLHHLYSNPHLHTPGGYTGIPHEKTWLAAYAAWAGVDKCHGQWKRGACVFGAEDLPLLKENKYFVANKFYMDLQPIAMECMDSWLEYRVKCPRELDLKYYKSLPFVKR